MQATSFKEPDCYKALENYVEWKKANIPPILSDMTAKMINSGFFYIHGRDRMFRPIIVINPRQLRAFKDYKMDDTITFEQTILACSFIMEYVTKHLHLPGQIENWILICDVGKLGISEIPVKLVGNVIGFLSDNYRCKSRRMFIVNTTYAIKIAWKVIQAFLKMHTKKKITLTDKSTDKELFEFAHPSQVERKFGGEAQDLETFWPPAMPSDEYDHDKKHVISEDEYVELLKTNHALMPRPDLVANLHEGAKSSKKIAVEDIDVEMTSNGNKNTSGGHSMQEPNSGQLILRASKTKNGLRELDHSIKLLDNENWHNVSALMISKAF